MEAERPPPPARPSTRRLRPLGIVAVWSVFGFFLAAQRYLRGPSLEPRMALSWWGTLGASLLTAGLWALMTPAAMAVARRRRPRLGALSTTLPWLIVASVAAALAHLTVTNLFWQIAESGAAGGFSDRFLATLAFGGTARLMTFVGILGATWALDDYRAYREKELRSSELERELVQTELESLKLRLHPTFLFRTLEALLPLIRSEPRTAATTVVQLGDLLRRTLHHDDAGLVPLRTELDSIRLYLEIERTRLGERLEVRFTIEPTLLDASVPHLILIPLVESAIANGVARRPGRSRIEVTASEDGEALRLHVRDRAVDASSFAAALDEAFVAKARRRLELLFPRRHTIVLSAEADGHAIAATLPLTRSRRAEAARGAA